MGRWKALLKGPVNGVANGVAYEIEHEWQESKMILEESGDCVPESCIINILTGDGSFEIEGRSFRYCGDVRNLLPGASPFKDAVAVRIGYRH